MRAAFKAVMDGKQVAVLVPTTVLAQQHWNDVPRTPGRLPGARRDALALPERAAAARDRRGHLIRARSISLIGTHRLVQKDVEFKDLGLVIIDEEQRFGVSHKERLKQMRAEVDSAHALGDADPAHAADVAGRHPRHEHHDDAAGGTPADPDLRLAVGRRTHARGHRPRDAARRAGVLRPQPGAQHRANRDATAGDRPRGAHPGGPRPDAGRAARARDDGVLCRRPRRAGVHDDHRERARHPEREHDHHQRREQPRARAALPAARPGRALLPTARTPTSCTTRTAR